jgi:SAM-dependent methyltransferase
MVRFDNRRHDKECIDDSCLDFKVLQETYQQLKSINDMTLGYWPTMSAVKYFLGNYGRGRELKILDIGCGDGESLRRIGDYAHLKKFSLELVGIDLNPDVIVAAIEATSSKNIRFIHGDALDDNHNETYDLIMSSLTMHHLKDEEIVKLIRWMSSRARIGWFVSDLHRHPIAYYFIKYFVKIFRFNPLICHDAPLSVARSFRRNEWSVFLKEAGLDVSCTRIAWYPNFRHGIRYEKSL